MHKTIKRFVQFPASKHGDWIFHVSISNYENIMIMVYHADRASDIMIRFFVDELTAARFVDEVKSYRYWPYLP